MNLKEIYTKYITVLSAIYNKAEAHAITDMAFDHFAKKKKSDIIVHAELQMEDVILFELENALARLEVNEPIQYVIGETWFYNLLFKVNKNVLIPRPETEELVEIIIAYLKQFKEEKNIIDIGTGSGCIPISIKKYIPLGNVWAIDVSDDALHIAKENARKNDVEINFSQVDFLNEVTYNEMPIFDVIISNPPYIPQNECSKLDKNVTMHEPHIALFVPDNDALIFYKKILLFAENNLATNGKIFLEVHEDLANETANVFVEKNYTVEIKKDMQEKNRMLLINRCQ
jgi:release factor glutamine methyltransferase